MNSSQSTKSKDNIMICVQLWINNFRFKINMIMIGEDKDLSDLREIQEEGIKKLVKEAEVGSNQKELREKIV